MFRSVAGTKVRQQDNMDNPQQANLEMSFTSSQFLRVEGQKLGSHCWAKTHKQNPLPIPPPLTSPPLLPLPLPSPPLPSYLLLFHYIHPASHKAKVVGRSKPFNQLLELHRQRKEQKRKGQDHQQLHSLATSPLRLVMREG